MRCLKYTLILILTVLLTGSLLHSPAQAITVTIDPVTQNVKIGDQAIVGVMIYGYAPGPPVNLAIGAYDFNIIYNPAILDFNSLYFGISLGNPANSITSHSNDSLNGILNITETSLLLPSQLYALQGQQWPDDWFIAATLTFNTLGKGVSPVSVDVNSLMTEMGGNFDNYYSDPGSVTVNSVPEPSTFLLLGAGFGGLAIMRRKRS